MFTVEATCENCGKTVKLPVLTHAGPLYQRGRDERGGPSVASSAVLERDAISNHVCEETDADA